jgi:hypothetical protein
LAAEEWSWNLPFYTPVVGDVQPWGDRVLVTAGGRQDGTTSVWLVTESGQIDWGIEIDSFAFRGELVEAL